MPRTRFFTAIAGAALGVSLLGACSAESIAEFGFEQALEASAEGDADIDLDFSNGGFSVNSEDGDFSINFDEEAGGIVFESDEGSGSILFDEEAGGIVFDTDEGEGTINFSEDGIVFDAEGTENDGTLNFNDNGGATLNTDGATSYFGVTTQPDDWPAIIVPPATNVDGETVYSAFGDSSGFIYSATYAHDAGEPFAQNTVDRLTDAGYVSQFQMTTPEGTSNSLSNGEFNVTVVEGEDGLTMVMFMPV